MTKIISKVVELDCPDNLSTKLIEKILIEKYGEIVRWAIVSVNMKKLKLSISIEEK